MQWGRTKLRGGFTRCFCERVDSEHITIMMIVTTIWITGYYHWLKLLRTYVRGSLKLISLGLPMPNWKSASDTSVTMVTWKEIMSNKVHDPPYHYLLKQILRALKYQMPNPAHLQTVDFELKVDFELMSIMLRMTPIVSVRRVRRRRTLMASEWPF